MSYEVTLHRGVIHATRFELSIPFCIFALLTETWSRMRKC